MGRMLRVNLTTETISVEPLSAAFARMWLGGTGLGAKILYDEVPGGVEWDDPENRLIIAAGPLAGTKVHGAGTYSAVTRGPMTNLLGATQANGFFGSYLKQQGYDAVILQGRAERWLYLYIAEGKAELRPADHLLGKDTWETEHALLEELGYKFRMLSVHSIGPAAITRRLSGLSHSTPAGTSSYTIFAPRPVPPIHIHATVGDRGSTVHVSRDRSTRRMRPMMPPGSSSDRSAKCGMDEGYRVSGVAYR